MRHGGSFKTKRLATLPRIGPKTAAKILEGVSFVRETGPLRLFYHAIVEARNLLAMVRAHPQVTRAALAGSLRRCVEVTGDVDIVAAAVSMLAVVVLCLLPAIATWLPWKVMDAGINWAKVWRLLAMMVGAVVVGAALVRFRSRTRALRFCPSEPGPRSRLSMAPLRQP